MSRADISCGDPAHPLPPSSPAANSPGRTPLAERAHPGWTPLCKVPCVHIASRCPLQEHTPEESQGLEDLLLIFAKKPQKPFFFQRGTFRLKIYVCLLEFSKRLSPEHGWRKEGRNLFWVSTLFTKSFLSHPCPGGTANWLQLNSHAELNPCLQSNWQGTFL